MANRQRFHIINLLGAVRLRLYFNFNLYVIMYISSNTSFTEGVMHENFNLEGFVIPLGENIKIEFLPKRKQYQMSSYFK